jgi:hypothetical protein
MMLLDMPESDADDWQAYPRTKHTQSTPLL